MCFCIVILTNFAIFGVKFTKFLTSQLWQKNINWRAPPRVGSDINTKIQQKIDGQNHQRGDKKGRPQQGQKMHNPQEPKKKGES